MYDVLPPRLRISVDIFYFRTLLAQASGRSRSTFSGVKSTEIFSVEFRPSDLAPKGQRPKKCFVFLRFPFSPPLCAFAPLPLPVSFHLKNTVISLHPIHPIPLHPCSTSLDSDSYPTHLSTNVCARFRRGPPHQQGCTHQCRGSRAVQDYLCRSRTYSSFLMPDKGFRKQQLTPVSIILRHTFIYRYN